MRQKAPFHPKEVLKSSSGPSLQPIHPRTIRTVSGPVSVSSAEEDEGEEGVRGLVGFEQVFSSNQIPL